MVNIAQSIPLADTTWSMHDGFGAGWMFLMMVLMVLFWGAIIFGVVWLIRGFPRGGPAPAETVAGRESPVEILERRFAEGAITADDYRERREVLGNGSAEPKAAARAEERMR